MCVLRFSDSVNFFPHVLHVYGFSPVCILMCLMRFPLLVQLFPHILHVYGFSPVCILKCLMRCPLVVQLFPHVLHVYGLSPGCMAMCVVRSAEHVKLSLHIQQVYGLCLLSMLCPIINLPPSGMHDATFRVVFLPVSFSSPQSFLAPNISSWHPVVEENICLMGW